MAATAGMQTLSGLSIFNPYDFTLSWLGPMVPMGPPTTVAEPTGGSVYSESISRAMEGYQRVIQQKGIPRDPMQWNPDQSEEWARFCKKEFNMTDFNPASLHIPGMDLCSMTPGFLTTTIVGPKYVAETLYLCLEKLKGTTSIEDMAYLQGPYTFDPNLPTINVTGSPRHPSVHNDETGLGVFDDNAP